MTPAPPPPAPTPAVMAGSVRLQPTRPAHRDYQTFWTTSQSPGWLELVLDQEATWLRDRLGLDADLTADADVRSADRTKRAQMLHRTSRKDHGTRLRVWNQNSGGTFIVTIIAVESPRGGWLQITVTASDPVVLAEKPFVADMILGVVDFEDVTPLRRDAEYTAAGGLDDLEALINSPERRLPTIVAAPVDGVPFDTWHRQVSEWTKQTVGIAHIVSLDPPASEQFSVRHGANAVHPGTLRTYPAGAGLTDPVTARTARWLSPHALAGKTKEVQRTIESFVRQHVASQPALLPSSAREWTRAFERISSGKLRDAVTPVQLPLQARRERFAALQRERAVPYSSPRDVPRDPVPIKSFPSTSASPGTRPRSTPHSPPPDPREEPRTGLPDGWATPRPVDEIDRLRGEIHTVRASLGEVSRARDALEDQLQLVQETLMLENLDEKSLVEIVDLATREIPDEASITALLEANETLESRIALRDEQIDDERSEKAEARRAATRLEEDLGRAQREIAYLREQVKRHDPEAAFGYVDTGSPTNPLGECPATWDQLVSHSQLAAHRIVITTPPKKLDAVSALDADGSALSSAWDAFGTLAAYRSAVREGQWDKDVHDFCESAPMSCFHVAPNKHARGESGPTKKDARYRKARLLPVPQSVAANGHVHMWAHFKPYSWAAEKKLRIHYYDQVEKDGTIYVGHIGEHLPSASTTKIHR